MWCVFSIPGTMATAALASLYQLGERRVRGAQVRVLKKDMHQMRQCSLGDTDNAR